MVYRCEWGNKDALSQKYHDERWGRVCHEDNELFAMLILEGFQAGLSWSLILQREEGIREACDMLDPHIVAKYDEKKIESLAKDTRMIKSLKKIEAMVHNAKIFLSVQEKYGSFDHYIWSFTNNTVIDNHTTELPPSYSPLSERVSKELKKIGFKYVGRVIVQSYLEAIGVINSHHRDCFVRGEMA